MGLSMLRAAVRSDRRLWRTLLITFAAVATIVIGLLAMHTLNLENGEGSGSVSPMAQSAHPMTMLSGGDAVGVGNECGAAPCSPEHSMTAMACILALLVSVPIIGMMRMIVAWRPMRNSVASLLMPSASLPAVAPPSLHLLCISRT